MNGLKKKPLAANGNVDKIFIVANGNVDGLDLGTLVHSSNMVIGVDGGTNALVEREIWPDLVVGDMDSIEPDILEACENRDIEVRRFPSEKDETDLELAIREAIKMSPQHILCAGILGDRPDHTLANLQLMRVPVEAGIAVKCFFEYGVVYVVSEKLELKGKPGDTVSLLPLTEKVKGITLSGFKYGLVDGEMILGIPLGISNVLENERGIIELGEGILLVFHMYIGDA